MLLAPRCRIAVLSARRFRTSSERLREDVPVRFLPLGVPSSPPASKAAASFSSRSIRIRRQLPSSIRSAFSIPASCFTGLDINSSWYIAFRDPSGSVSKYIGGLR